MSIPELLIDDVIGAGFWYDGITSKYVNSWLREHAKAKELLVRINSPGGDVFEGHAIYAAFNRCEAHVVMEVEGLAASAASVILMAADERRVHKGGFVMVHEAAGGTWGKAADHEKTAELLRKINGEIADLYAARSGQTTEKCLELMAANDTWLSADDALGLGFCDSVVGAKGKTTGPKAPKSKAAARLMSQYRNAPAAVMALLDAVNDFAPAVPAPAPPRVAMCPETIARHVNDFAPRALARSGS